MHDESNIHKYFKPLWYLNACFGVSNPFVFIIARKTKLATVCKCTYDFIVVFLALGYLALTIKSENRTGGNVFQKYFSIISRTLFTLTAAVLVTANIYKRGKLLLIIKQLHLYEQKLNNLSGSKSHLKSSQGLVRLLIAATGFWTFKILFHTTVHSKSNGIAKDLLKYVNSYFPAIAISLYTMQFVAFGLAIEKLYLTINGLLANILGRTGKVTQLYAIQALQNRLYKTSLILNECHSLPLLTLCACQFTLLFANTYFYLFGYPLEEKIVIPHTATEHLLPILGVLKDIAIIWLVTSASEGIARRRAETGRIIYTLPLEDDEILIEWVLIFFIIILFY